MNKIEWVTEGEHQGKLKFNVSTSPIASKNIIVDQNNAEGVYSLDNDDMGVPDVDNNVVRLTNYHDASTGKVVSEGFFVLPADSWRDYNTLDWVLSIKHNNHTDSTSDLFNDLMIE